MRNDNEKLISLLTSLSRAAGNDKTRADVLECAVLALHQRDDIQTLQKIVRGEIDNLENAEDA
jgi:hypothetical protein